MLIWAQLQSKAAARHLTCLSQKKRRVNKVYNKNHDSDYTVFIAQIKYLFNILQSREIFNNSWRTAEVVAIHSGVDSLIELKILKMNYAQTHF